MKEIPKISIITITYNAEKVLERTIISILSQTYKNIEYIIIDGASKDGTLKIVEKYKNDIDIFITEPDKGLYDAMNKGLKAATGEYVWFMNAGDEIFDENTTENIFKNIEADIYYGNALFVNDNGEHEGLRDKITPHLLPVNLNWKDLRFGMTVCHQAFIARKSIAPLYDLNHPYSADIDWEIKCLKEAKSIANTHLVICKYLTGGFSKKNLIKSLKDRYVILKKHFGTINVFVNHAFIIVRSIKFILKKFNSKSPSSVKSNSR